MQSMADVKWKILIVDDNSTNLLILQDHLVYAGFDVISATDGESCCQLAAGDQPGLILLDIMMPGIDGFETLERLKNDEKTKQIPVIFMSSLSQTEHKVRGFESGAVDYITKPFQQEEVVARVTTHLTIQQQEKQLRELVATKDKLFSIIAHDLRTPFNSLIGYSDLLLQQYNRLDEKKILKAIDQINTSSKEAFTMLENLLAWARSQMGILSWRTKKLVLFPLVNSVLTMLNLTAQKKEIQIKNEIDPELRIMGSHELLSTVFRNLVSNALKYTKPEGSITIKALTSDDKVVISVCDTGVGIADQYLDRLFRIDSMFTTVGTANEKGTGLGLVLCKEFINSQGGTISVKSTQGKGTEFSIHLPHSILTESKPANKS